MPLIIAAIVVIGFINYCYNNFFSNTTIVGKYVNQNYNNKYALAEIPNVADTLELFENNHFESDYWGKGTFTISYSLQGTTIELIYKDEFGKGGFETTISRVNWGAPKIILSSDQDRYYEKIEE